MTKIYTLNSKQIGGNVVVVETSKSKIAIDFGENLPGNNSKNIEIEGLSKGKAIFDGVFFTHYHSDHIGRMKDVLSDVPLYMGKIAREILLNINTTIKNDENVNLLTDEKRIIEISENTPILINNGDITITPYTVDHSAYEAFMFLIETKDKTILHTGDFREHGYRGKKGLLPTIQHYIRKNGKRDVDILITEGTMFSRMNEDVFTEAELQKWAKEFFKEHKHIFLICSSANLDSLASFYQAGISHNMNMFGNSFVIKQLKTFSKYAGEKSSLYKFDKVWNINFNKQLEKNHFKGTQEDYMRKFGFVCLIKETEKYEKWIEKFKDCNPVVIYSMWDGYLNPKSSAYNEKLDLFCKKYNAVHKHTSGHATAKTIAKVIEAVDPKEAIYPIHTEKPEMIYNLDIKEELKEKIVIKNDNQIKFPEEFNKNGRLEDVKKFVEEKQKEGFKLKIESRGIENNTTVYYKKNGVFLRFIKDETNKLKMCINFDYAKNYTEKYEEIEAELKSRFNFEKFEGSFLTRTLKDDEKISYDFMKEFFNYWLSVMKLKFCGRKELDTRTINFIDDLCENGALEEVVKFVKTRKDTRLALLFRGNSGNGKLTVYCNNHIFWEFEKRNKKFNMSISINHAKEPYDTEETKKMLSEKYGFNKSNKTMVTKTFNGDETVKDKFLEDLYNDWKPIFDNFFVENTELEKKRQQDVFLDPQFKNAKSGYFVYDLEYATKYKGKKERENNEFNNKPDFLAIRFENSEPKALVLGEIKSKEGACEGKSGVEKHLRCMKNFNRENEITTRLKDVVQIMNDYKKIGLYPCEMPQVKSISLELLFVFTDKSIPWIKNNKEKIFKDINHNDKNLPETLETQEGQKEILCISVPLRNIEIKE